MSAQEPTGDALPRSAPIRATAQDAALLAYIHALSRGTCYVVVENGQPVRWGRHRTRHKTQVIDAKQNVAYNAPG